MLCCLCTHCVDTITVLGGSGRQVDDRNSERKRTGDVSGGGGESGGGDGEAGVGDYGESSLGGV